MYRRWGRSKHEDFGTGMGVGSAVLQPPSALHCAVATAPSSPAWSLCPQSGASVCTSTTAHAELPREPEHGLPGGVRGVWGIRGLSDGGWQNRSCGLGSALITSGLKARNRSGEGEIIGHRQSQSCFYFNRQSV